ncbi:MAG: EAL domain-containing protein [Actinomycetota bacterium]|nr:EAL domain-containing protein [Actinomycetota bacterium]
MGPEDGEQRSWQRDGRPLVLAGEPRLAYQPIVDLGNGQLLGFEALLRWDLPDESVIYPPLLIPWAEANGDIVALGEWVLAEGCRQAVGWPASVQLAVNCSIVQLRRGVAYQAVCDALKGSDLAPDRLTIEVTERALAEPLLVSQLKGIVDLGVQLAVDDVGTSWSSFELVKQLAVNTVKIDESFVAGLESTEGINRMVVETVVHLAHSSGMATVAEGVEKELQATLVREFESDAAQGYFFAPPLSDSSAAEMARRPDLRFPLDGAGWQDDDSWPFPGIEAERYGAEGEDPLGTGRRNAPLPVAPPVELDAIDLIDLALEGNSSPPLGAFAPVANGHGGEEGTDTGRGSTTDPPRKGPPRRRSPGTAATGNTHPRPRRRPAGGGGSND